MQKYMMLMTSYGNDAGIDFKFGGEVANTLDAHRLIQHFQEEKGTEVANKIVGCAQVAEQQCAFSCANTTQRYTANTLRTRSTHPRGRLCCKPRQTLVSLRKRRARS